MNENVRVEEKREYELFKAKWKAQVEAEGAEKLLKDHGADEKATRFLKQVEADIETEKRLDKAFVEGFNSVKPPQWKH